MNQGKGRDGSGVGDGTVQNTEEKQEKIAHFLGWVVSPPGANANKINRYARKTV